MFPWKSLFTALVAVGALALRSVPVKRSPKVGAVVEVAPAAAMQFGSGGQTQRSSGPQQSSGQQSSQQQQQMMAVQQQQAAAMYAQQLQSAMYAQQAQQMQLQAAFQVRQQQQQAAAVQAWQQQVAAAKADLAAWQQKRVGCAQRPARNNRPTCRRGNAPRLIDDRSPGGFPRPPVYAVCRVR